MLAFTAASAAPLNDHLRGVWSGTLGAAKVMACFGIHPVRQEVGGSYYDTKYQEPLALSPTDDKQAFKELVGASWTLVANGSNALSGSWRKEESEQQMSVHLTRMPGTAPSDNCGSDVYLQPVLDRVMQMRSGESTQPGERRYRPLSLAGCSWWS